jgi:hypothetical protein
MTMYPQIKKFSLIDEDAPASITSSGTLYSYVIEKWSCLDCKYEGDNNTFIYKNRVISITENTHSSEFTLHCPECDSQNIKRPDPPKIEFYGNEGKLD